MRLHALLLCCLQVLAWPVAAEFPRVLEGHGGPIMGVAISAGGDAALTASFDNSVGFWSSGGSTQKILSGHAAAVNTVVFLPDGRAASGGDDFSISIWDLRQGQRILTLEGHQGKVQSLAVSGDGDRLASASWDGTGVVWDLETGARLFDLEGHNSNVNDIVFQRDGGLLTASADGTIRQWDATGNQVRIVVRHGFGINRLVVNQSQGWIAYGAVDGGTRAVDFETGEVLADLTLERRPILAMAASPDGRQIAVGDGQGYIMVVSTEDWSIQKDFKAAKQGPVWALDYTADGASVLAGGIDDNAYFFPINVEGERPQMSKDKRDFHRDPATMSNGERQFRRKCSVCHTLGENDKNRAGPSLNGVFGRTAGKLVGYEFSAAMTKSEIIWSEETINLLFELGPDNYVPGSKMPMQVMQSEQDRRDLIDFLRQTTANEGALK